MTLLAVSETMTIIQEWIRDTIFYIVFVDVKEFTDYKEMLIAELKTIFIDDALLRLNVIEPVRSDLYNSLAIKIRNEFIAEVNSVTHITGTAIKTLTIRIGDKANPVIPVRLLVSIGSDTVPWNSFQPEDQLFAKDIVFNTHQIVAGTEHSIDMVISDSRFVCSYELNIDRFQLDTQSVKK